MQLQLFIDNMRQEITLENRRHNVLAPILNSLNRPVPTVLATGSKHNRSAMATPTRQVRELRLAAAAVRGRGLAACAVNQSVSRADV